MSSRLAFVLLMVSFGGHHPSRETYTHVWKLHGKCSERTVSSERTVWVWWRILVTPVLESAEEGLRVA